MNPRLLAGRALIVAAFALIFLMGYGVIEPFGPIAGAPDLHSLLVAAAPALLVPFGLFLAGLWLVRSARHR